MPELPEVETIVKALRQGGRGGDAILGKRVESSYLAWERTLAYPGYEVFKEHINNKVVDEVNRRGKYILIRLGNEYLAIHLRMTGDLRVETRIDENGETPLRQHDRFVLYFDDGLRFVFNDPRKFGRIWLVDDLRLILDNLGPEPLDPSFTPHALYESLQNHGKRNIKALLLDQKVIAGIGNIYTDEALFAAGIHPLRLAGQIDPIESEILYHSIQSVLLEGIRRNGASFDWVYRGGKFEFQVYQREGQTCKKCGATIQKISVGQRGTHYCPMCQPILR